MTVGVERHQEVTVAKPVFQDSQSHFRKTLLMQKLETVLGCSIEAFLDYHYFVEEEIISMISQTITKRSSGEYIVSGKTIRKWLDMVGVPKRTRKEAARLSWQDPLVRKQRVQSIWTAEARQKRRVTLSQHTLEDRAFSDFMRAKTRRSNLHKTIKEILGEDPGSTLRRLHQTELFSVKSIAHTFGLSCSTVRNWLREFGVPILNIHTRHHMPEKRILVQKARANGMLYSLSPIESAVLTRRFLQDRYRSMAQVAGEFNLTRSYIGQIEERALKILAEKSSIKNIADIEVEITGRQ